MVNKKTRLARAFFDYLNQQDSINWYETDLNDAEKAEAEALFEQFANAVLE